MGVYDLYVMTDDITCAQCGEEAFVANMYQNHDGELICHDCYCGPAPEDAPEMPTVDEVLNT